jgi:signal transduction histidine kinase/DNA-binding response OmpR family regulator
MTTPLRVLLVEDVEDDTLRVLRELQNGGYEVVWERVDTSEAMADALDRETWNIVLCDYVLPRFSGLAALQLLQDKRPGVPALIVSPAISEERAVTAMKGGAQDYVVMENLGRLVPAVQRTLREAAERRARQRAAADIDTTQAYRALQEEGQVSAALVRVGQELIQSLDRPVLLERLGRLTTETLGCDCSHTLFWDPAEHAYTMVSGYGDTAEQWESIRVLKIPRAVVKGLMARLERDEVVPLVVTEPQDLLLAGLSQQYGITAGLYVALRRGDEVVGVHTAGYRGESTPFNALQVRIMRGIGQLASLALEHARVVEELERANRLKYDFVATMSHELRTPLNVIMGYGDLLLEGAFGTLAPDQGDAVRRVARSGRQLLDLINATLDLGRLEAGRLEVQLREVRLAELVRELDAETRELQQKPGVCFEWQLPSRLPVVSTDPLKLKVVIKNLIDNAMKFTEAGGVSVRIRARERGVEIVVTDTGIGIPPEVRPIIFEPFRQADSSTTRRYGGVGLGLYIVQRLVDLLGGTIAVESDFGRGSTFRVWLPTGRRNVAPA